MSYKQKLAKFKRVCEKQIKEEGQVQIERYDASDSTFNTRLRVITHSGSTWCWWLPEGVYNNRGHGWIYERDSCFIDYKCKPVIGKTPLDKSFNYDMGKPGYVCGYKPEQMYYIALNTAGDVVAVLENDYKLKAAGQV